MTELKFVLDVDGVLTTGQFLYSSDGKAYKIFGAHDADGIKMIKESMGIFFISADHRGFDISERRIKDMGFDLYLVPEQDRYTYIKEKFGFANLIYMGDGIHDVPILEASKFGIVPENARKEAKAAADFITESRGGQGAVLDACLEIKERFLNKVEV